MKRVDGKFDVFLNGELVDSGVTEPWIEGALCARYGFCGDEGRAILREVSDNGRASIRF